MKSLSEQLIIDLTRMKADIRRLNAELTAFKQVAHPPVPHFMVVAPTGGIPAISADQPGSVSCNMVRRWGSSGDLTENAKAVKVYNFTANAIAEGAYVLAHIDPWGDYYITDSGSGMALIECAADEDFATTDASFDCIHGGALLGTSSGSSTDTITVKNTAGIFEGSTGDAILALEVGGIYEMIQKEC